MSLLRTGIEALKEILRTRSLYDEVESRPSEFWSPPLLLTTEQSLTQSIEKDLVDPLSYWNVFETLPIGGKHPPIRFRLCQCSELNTPQGVQIAKEYLFRTFSLEEGKDYLFETLPTVLSLLFFSSSFFSEDKKGPEKVRRMVQKHLLEVNRMNKMLLGDSTNTVLPRHRKTPITWKDVLLEEDRKIN